MFDRVVTRLKKGFKRLASRDLLRKATIFNSAADGAVTSSATSSGAALTEQLLYQYSAIDKAKRAFRLLILRAGTGQDIDCELFESTLDSKGLAYEAVSYTWGPNFTADTVNINGKKLPVTFNLSLILRDLRFADVDRVIWVDAICINQQDATEKGHQVAQMQDVYAFAERVLFCIARPTDYTEILMDSLERLQSEIQTIDLSDDSAVDACWSKTQTAIAHQYLGSQSQPSAETSLSVQSEALTFLQRQGLEYILGQAWFSRVWILQEVANARDALVYCGQKSVSAAVFVLGARLLEYSLPDERRNTVDEVLNLMPGFVRQDPSQDILSLFRSFGKANASVERDRIYALFGICEDKKIQIHVTPNYIKSEQEVIIDTIAYICHCEVSAVAPSPYNSIAHFLSALDLFENTMLSHFLRLKNHRGASSFLQRYGQSVFVTSDMLNMAVDNTMMEEGVMSQLLEQRNSDTLLSGQEGWKPLLFAAEHGYHTLVKKMLEKGAFIEALYPQGFRPVWENGPSLSLAAMNGHESVVKILLENGASMSSPRRGAPLAWAARNGHISIAQLLVEKGCDIEGILNERTPLSWAASEGHEVIVKLLLKHGADPTSKARYTIDTPLSRAAEEGHRVIVQILIESRANIDGSCMRFALKCAARAAQISIVSLLLDSGTSIDLLDVLDAAVEETWEGDDRREDFEAIVMMMIAKGAHFRGSSKPLLRAAAAGNERMVRLFLDHGAKVDYMVEGYNDGTALAHAVRYGHVNVAELLLAEGAHLESRDSQGRTPLFMAASSGHENVVNMLLGKGADIGARDCDGQPAFVRAATVSSGAVGNWDIVKLLLEKGPDVEVNECNGKPLFYAARSGRGDIVKMLLARGADVDTRNEYDQTALSGAAQQGHADIVKVLLENGANIDVLSASGSTLLFLAAFGGYRNAVKVLLENGANVKAVMPALDTNTSLHLAAENGSESTVRVLLENGADTESRNKADYTPLHLAVFNGHENVVKVLLENGADIEAKDYDQRTPLTLAAYRNEEDVIKLLLESGANPNVNMTRAKKLIFS